MEATSTNRRSSAGGPAGILRAGGTVEAGGMVVRRWPEIELTCAALARAGVDREGADLDAGDLDGAEDVDETAA